MGRGCVLAVREMSKMVALRLDQALWHAVKERAQVRRMSASQLVDEALRVNLGHGAPERDAGARIRTPACQVCQEPAAMHPNAICRFFRPPLTRG
jgi:hypothetical protein